MSSRRFVIIGAGISLIAAAACVLPKPRPPHPPAPSTYELRVFALRSDGIAIPGATVYRDNAREDLETVEVDGSVVWRQLAATNVAFNVCAGAPGYFNASTGSDRKCAPVGVAGQAAGVIHITLDARPTPPPPPPPPASAPSWTKSQLLDIQGDLMIWAPDVGCDSAETGIRCDAAGLRAGYVWWLSPAALSGRQAPEAVRRREGAGQHARGHAGHTMRRRRQWLSRPLSNAHVRRLRGRSQHRPA
jgi:hypothetical protein